MSRALAAALLLAAVATGCATRVIRPTADDVAWSARQGQRTTLERLVAGRDLYVGRCASCHNLHAPDEFPPERWQSMVGDMRKAAHLSADEADLIVGYLMTASARLRAQAGSEVARARP